MRTREVAPSLERVMPSAILGGVCSGTPAPLPQPPFSSVSTQQLKDQGRAKYCHKMSFIATVLLCTGQVAKLTLRGSLLKIPKNPASCVELYKIILLKIFFFFLKKVSYPEALRAQFSCNCDSSPSLKAFSLGWVNLILYIYNI